ncbi:LCP family protein [Brevibacillus ruminantium]|uniref:LCP family protein n=1 Tax=Brevibacillus ruminantium TaxID=2950604 RepID=A0ABY4WJ36_9BACL|nr:LCP family protein [Brevibacillus ruminantium]USG67146.1 LCP family protein [Brevibacillus ruminantium]
MKPVKEWRRQTKWLAALVALCLLGLLAFAGSFVWSLYQTAADIYHPVERLPSVPRQLAVGAETAGAGLSVPVSNQPEAQKEESKQKKIETFLLLGVDRESNSPDRGRTDVILLVIYNQGSGKITLLSLPRDTYVEIAGKGKKDKVNHAYGYGVETTIATVENFMGVPVDHYVLANFDGFQKVIDLLGGITLDVDEHAALELELPAGERHLSGEQALTFARFRGDREGDFGRNARHQQVIKALVEQTRSLRSPGKIKEILSVVGDDLRTDVALTEMISLATSLNEWPEMTVEQLRYTGRPARFGPQSLSYVIIEEAEQKRVTEQLIQALRIP